uniref:Uncharacterized protein n=1 Tax=Candidatus Kentrum eta TaxID=2126337 RepID=A0A450VKU4_9GAMM|nr:MAG: hypothetical protein BECKH772B_GA0070898_102761 [Candidatus Kentron sp. H]VFK02432.1 MAG: hypothetical protein BECKH772A_GA0070896_102691 [Candidatus Kentron sp. H]VFK05434.1 MAG: hypothetical protein BECKH772C_GA0070978_102711 [Candidatus Kentron sp. H]
MEDIEPVFARLHRTMEHAAHATYTGADMAPSPSRQAGMVLTLPLAVNQGGMVFCRDGRRVMRRLFATGLYAVKTTFEEGQPGASRDGATEVTGGTGEVRLLDDNAATEELRHPDPEESEGGVWWPTPL